MQQSLTTEQATRLPLLLSTPTLEHRISHWARDYAVHGPKGFVLPNDETEAAYVREELIGLGVPKKKVDTLVSARLLHEMLLSTASDTVRMNFLLCWGPLKLGATEPYTAPPWVVAPVILDDPVVFRAVIGTGHFESEASAHKAADIMRYALVRNEQLKMEIEERVVSVYKI